LDKPSAPSSDRHQTASPTVAGYSRHRFWQILDAQVCVHPASVYDPVSARIAQDIGFELGMFAGSIASLTVLGAPDAILLTLSEFSQQARRICRACPLPLMCDADHGYGNALNVMRTVEELENAGIAGLSIEDTLLPAQFGKVDKVELISIEEGRAKIGAALEARQDRDLVIVGRTSAAKISDAKDAARRLRAYEEAGADALFAVGVATRDDLDIIAGETSLPLIVGGIGKNLMDREYLASRKVRMALQGHQPYAAAVQAVYETLKDLREGVAPSDLKGTASADLLAKTMRHDIYLDRVQRYLKDD
jgi:carboxyvinyl-carboxyphosphonate phosphorylmutase